MYKIENLLPLYSLATQEIIIFMIPLASEYFVHIHKHIHTTFGLLKSKSSIRVVLHVYVPYNLISQNLGEVVLEARNLPCKH